MSEIYFDILSNFEVSILLKLESVSTSDICIGTPVCTIFLFLVVNGTIVISFVKQFVFP